MPKLSHDVRKIPLGWIMSGKPFLSQVDTPWQMQVMTDILEPGNPSNIETLVTSCGLVQMEENGKSLGKLGIDFVDGNSA